MQVEKDNDVLNSFERLTSRKQEKGGEKTRNVKIALTVCGSINTCIIDNPETHEQYLNILKYCETVIVYRANPGEKASIVNFVKRKTNCIALAIGDGGNDVPINYHS